MLKSLKRFFPVSIENPAEAWTFLALTGSISLVLLSIAISQILLAAAIVGYVWNSKRSDIRTLLHHPMIPPLAAFVIWTIVTSLVSPYPLQSLTALKKVFLYILPLLIFAVVRRDDQVGWMYKSIFTVSSVACAIGVVQFLLNPNRGPLDRIRGPMSHWMTYSGLLMLVFVMLMAYALCLGWREHKWVVPLALLLTLVLILTQTRNAWIGVIAAAFVIVLLRRPRATIGLVVVIPLVFLVVYLVMPGLIKDRLLTVINNKDPRIEIFETSLRLIGDNPWFGVGYKNVNHEALRYRGNKDLPDWAYQHMHNNLFQIAAERGIPGLLIWLWLMLRLILDALRGQRSRAGSSKESQMISTAALGAGVAFLLAGLFEYNFGDTEVLTLFLFIMGAPYVFRQFRMPDSKLQTPASQE